MNEGRILAALLALGWMMGCGDQQNPEVGPLERCRTATDVDACLIEALDGPTDADELAALIEAHERTGNDTRAADLRRRYAARFDDARSATYREKIASADALAEDGDAPPYERWDDAPPQEGADDAPDHPIGNPLMDCASQANYNACIVRNLRNPSSPREYEALINAYRETGQRSRACVLMNQVITRYPTSPAARRFVQYVERQCP